jgi:sensor histidine kinase regulating citrate/malate metabolism
MNQPPAIPSAVGHGTTPEAAILAAMALQARTGRAADTRPAEHTPLVAWLTVLLDQIACGLVLVDAQARVRYLNLAALRQLDSQNPLVLAGQTLQTRDPEDQAQLKAALAAAGQGQRRLVTLGHAKQTIEVSVVPLRSAGGG